jgi:hypothetical protein
MESTKLIEDYIKYVQKTLETFSDIGNLINNGEISPNLLNTALAKYYNTSLALNSEYQRQKINHSVLETEYQVWYDEKFLESKKLVITEYSESKSIKPSVKEYEITLRSTFKAEWLEWDLKLKESEAKTQFLLRLRESLNKYDSILTTIANNMRSEMRSLSIDQRSNANDNVSSSHKIRTRFPINN